MNMDGTLQRCEWCVRIHDDEDAVDGFVSTDSENCCAFSGGPFVESRYFGEGVGIAVRKGNDLLRQSLNWALFRLWEKGRYTELWLRYFSVSPF